MKLYFSFLLIIFISVSQAQSEADSWFFGSGSGLKFNGTSKPFPQYGSLRTFEGCASISDGSGNLLFYSDGSTVWSRDHKIMPRGINLLGDESSTQSALIVPHPTLTNIYYLFTVGSTQVPSGYHYYTIDMNKNNGMGDVIGSAVDLSGDSDGYDWSEKITAVNGDECNVVWVISLVSNLYYVYKVDENGVNPTPVISQVNFISSPLSRGYLKVSPNGKKLASAHQGKYGSDHGLYLYSFDNSNGKVINDGITLFDKSIQTYGVEFSPKSTKLYASTINDDEYKLFQFDLSSSNIKNSAVLIHEEQPAYRGGLQLGPDLKIYATIPETYTIGSPYLDVILFPELKGSACNFITDYIFLGADNVVMQGLPPFIQSFFYEGEINIVNPFEPVTVESRELELCLGESYTLMAENIIGAEYQWSFNNGKLTVDLPTPSPANQLNINTIGDNISGLYTLHVITNDECNSLLTGEANVSFTTPPVINPFASLNSCDLFDDNSNDGLTTFNLENSLTDITYGNPDNYDVYFYLNDVDAETDLYNQNSLPQFYRNTNQNQIISTKIFVKNSKCYSLGKLQLFTSPSITLNAIAMAGCDINNNANYIFDLDEQQNSIIILNGLSSTIDIQFFETIENAVNIESPLDNNFESSNKTIYFYATDNGQCYGSGSFNLIVNPLPPINTEEETLVVCYNQFPLILDSSIDSELVLNYDFLWSSGEISSSIMIYFDQTVSVKVTDKNSLCEAVKTFKVIQSFSPVISGVEININNGKVTILTTENLENSYALDDPNGFYQIENIFYNVSPGIHNVYVKNENECNITSREIFVLGFPKFFTPNNDSNNDFWEIKGLELDKYSISNIKIFNRYGKLLKELSPDSKWDGTYNGKKLPASDYWFFVDIIDLSNNIKTYKGHFSLVL
ncbi:T9SS type B sorting domain-containing protein [Gaetbulibacter aquiaggeris]|uniref:T9SS type B sorting domain-containing protein n=1 Tax=Gaetbulibacter aquiaggeris TaxID=1735373 RepID=A0ABW7MKR4_9FLAO